MIKKLLCRLRRHRCAPHMAVITGPGLLYSKATFASVIIRSVCTRPGCFHVENEEWVCPVILCKALSVRRIDV